MVHPDPADSIEQQAPYEAHHSQRQTAKLERAERKALRRAERQSQGPGAWRTYVLPILKLAVAAVIAIALVKFAFFPAQEQEAAGESAPMAAFTEPMVAAAIGTVRNDVELDGQVVTDDSVPVRATQTGRVNWIGVENGQGVAEGDSLYQVTVETQPEITTVDPEAPAPAPAPTVQYFTISAPAAGVLTGFDLIVGQDVQIATATGAIRPASFHISAPLTPSQQYRLVTQPTEAQVLIQSGPAPFTCTNLTIEQPSNDAASDGSGGVVVDPSAPEPTSAIATCQIPGDVRVFAGLTATVTIGAGVAENVLTLPVTAVLGTADTGVVFQLDESGMPVELPVTLGINDGNMIEITGGLNEGDEVMQFAPGADAGGDQCADPMTGELLPCEDLGVVGP